MMTLLLLIIAVFFQYQLITGQSIGIYTRQPRIKQSCDYDAFVSSTPINEKVFLLPWKQSDRLGDWYQARAYCAEHCAEIATIKSDAQFALANNFVTSNYILTGDVFTNNYWLGAQVVNTTNFRRWSNGESADYQPKGSGEYNEPGLTCLHVYILNQLKFWNYYCNTQFAIVCQRPARWTPCERPCYRDEGYYNSANSANFSAKAS